MSLDHGPAPDGTDRSDEAEPGRVRRRARLARTLVDAGYGDVFVLSWESADRALTPARRDLLDAIAREDVPSQNELARRLDRDPGNVKRDVAVLVEEGLVSREPNGTAYRLDVNHDAIVVEPVPFSGQ